MARCRRILTLVTLALFGAITASCGRDDEGETSGNGAPSTDPPVKLSLSGTSSGRVGSCLSGFGVTTLNSSDQAANTTQNVTLTLSGNVDTLFYVDSTCQMAIENLTIEASSSSANFYVRHLTAETLTLTATDTAGTLTESTLTLEISDRSWGTSTAVDKLPGKGSAPRISINSGGKAVLTFVQNTALDGSGRDDVFAAVYEGGWGDPVEIDNADGGHAREPDIVLDGAGNAIVVWTEDSGTSVNLYVNRLNGIADTWSGAQELDTGNTNAASLPKLVMDPSKNAFLVWKQSDGTAATIYRSKYTFSSNSWSTPTALETSNETATSPQIAIDSGGNAMAVWAQKDTGESYDSIWAARYTATDGTWGTPTKLETLTSGPATSPKVVMDGDDNALAVWRQSTDGGVSTHNTGARYSASSWGSAGALDSVPGSSQAPDFAIDAYGNALIAWAHGNGTNDDLYQARFEIADLTWESPAVIDDQTLTTAASATSISLDPVGNGLAVWGHASGSELNLYYNRYLYGVGWDSATLLLAIGVNALSPHVLLSANGDGAATWVQVSNNDYSLYASFFE